MFTQLFVATVLAISAHSASAASCSRSYVVQPGDYCDKISQAQNVSTYQLAVVNQHVDASCSNLIPGESLCLAQNSAEDCTTTYIVRSGDTCAGIASKAGLNTTLLYLNNPQIDEKCSNIYNNEVLCIAPTVRAPAIPAGGVSVTAVSTTLFVAPTQTPTPANVLSTTPVPAKTTSTHALAPAKTSSAASSGDDDECDGDNASGDDDEDCDEDGSDDGDDDDLPFCDEL